MLFSLTTAVILRTYFWILEFWGKEALTLRLVCSAASLDSGENILD